MAVRSLVERVQAWGGPADKAAARTLLRASLGAVSARLSAQDRATLARALPSELRDALQGQRRDAEASLFALAAEVAGACGLEHGHALEQLEIACRAVAERLDDAEREGLLRRIPDELARLFAQPAVEHSPARPSHAHGAAPTESRHISSAGPGGQHPLSEARPDSGQSGSVARWDGQRTARTLGGYQGDEREQHGETLATGKPGSKHGLSDG